MKVLIINNLASGYREGSIYDFMRSLIGDGDEVCIRSTDGTTSVSSLLVDAADFDAVVASGGDGTVATVAYCLRDSGVPVLPFPAGTANLLSLNLMSPNEPHALAKMVKKGLTLDFDLGEIETEKASFGFAIMAGAGYDAVIMKEAATHKLLWGPMAYVSAALAHIDPQYSHISITLDGGETIETDGIGVLVTNFSKIQFDIPITHENQPRDGYLGIVVLKSKNAIGLLPALFSAILDRDGKFPDRSNALEIYNAREAHVVADPPLEIQYDGEPTGITTPFTGRILPSACKMFVSDEGFKTFSDAEAE